MARFASILGVVLLLGCGGDDDGPSLPTGTFRLVGETLNGVATPASRLHGALSLDDTTIAMAVATTPPTGALGAYTSSGDALSVSSGGPTFTVTTSGGQITLAQGQSQWTFAPFTPTPALDAVTLTGTVSSQAALVRPRIAQVFLSRSEPFVADIRDDRALSFSSGSAQFDLSRDRPALGTERIPFGGQQSGIAIGFLVVYEDRNDSASAATPHGLDELAVCTTTTIDCIRAISPIILAYRDGETPQLAASPYAELRDGWTFAVQVQHRTVGKLGLVSSDSAAYPYAIVLGDPSAVSIPQFDLGEP